MDLVKEIEQAKKEGWTALDLSGCSSLSDVSVLSDLKSLTNLNLSRCNSLSDVSVLSDLKSLTDLNLSRCYSLSDVSVLSDLKSLTDLNLSYCNSLSDVSVLSDLKSLTDLDLSDCSSLSDVSVLSDLKSLTALFMANCPKIDDIPQSIFWSKILHFLTLYGCSLKGIPPELLGDYSYYNCLESVRSHLRDLEAGQYQEKELKLIVLGNGRVGKTSITKRLFHNTFDPDEDSTHGIRLEILEIFEYSEEDSCCLNVWDFGGQDIYHGTHALFLKSRAVFLIVWDATTEKMPYYKQGELRFDNHPLNYWCDYVRSVSPKSPVIVVQNKCDSRSDDSAVIADIGAWPSVSFSAKKGRGKAPLLGHLREACEELLATDQYTIGSGRAEVKKKIKALHAEDEKRARENKEKKYQLLSKEDFDDFCAEENRSELRVSSTDELLSYFHHTGVLYYENNTFGNQIILDQRWAIDAIYTIYHRDSAYRQLCAKKGRFTRQDLNDLVWEEQGYSAQEQGLFMSFMVSCGICFPVTSSGCSSQSIEYLAPDLLPEDEMVLTEINRYKRLGGEEFPVKLQLGYKFLHQDLLRRLMAIVEEKYPRDALYWRNGLIFEDVSSNSVGEVIFEFRIDHKYPGRGRVTLKTSGRNKELLLRSLYRSISKLHKDDDIETVLACIDNEHWIDTAKLEDGLKTNSVVTECGESLEAAPYRFLTLQMQDEDTLELPRRSERDIVTKLRPVYISYAWGDDTPEGKERLAVVERLQQSLEADGYDVRRDKDQIKYRDSIAEFMDEIGEAPCVVAVISEKYLHSEYCMHELVSCWREGNFTQRTAPIVLKGLGLSDLETRLTSVKHWSDKLVSIKNLLDTVPRENLSTKSGVQEQFDRLRRIAQNTDEVIGELADMNTLTPEQLEADDFAIVKSAIDASLANS